MIEIDRIIEGVFWGLFGRRRIGPITRWVKKGEPIPLTCRKCGALFITRNIGYIGMTEIYYGDNYDACKECKHDIRFLEPNLKKFMRGEWE